MEICSQCNTILGFVVVWTVDSEGDIDSLMYLI